jgi:membrane-associated phospholipid phosphatase
MFLVPPSLGHRRGPNRRAATQGLLLLALAPGIILWLAVVGLGEVLVGPLKVWTRSESVLNRSLQDTRNPTWDSVTGLWSHLGNTEIIIGTCALAVAVVWWRTRRWWFAAIPALAISLQATIFVTASSVIDRPRPTVPHLDVAPPTSSYPSGHVGASVALYASLAIMSSRIERAWLRRTAIFVCCLIPVVVAYARLYRGMHHVSDVLVGAVLGLACAAFASRSLTSQTERSEDD